MLDVLFISIDDWANVGALFQEACRTVGLNALAVAKRQHPFGYRIENVLYRSHLDARELVKTAKVVVFMHSTAPFGKIEKIPGVTFGVFHGGAQYRRNPVAQNEFWNPLVDFTLIQTAELLHPGAKNKHWVIPPVDTDLISPVFHDVSGRKLTFAHFPREPVEKGSSIINEIMKGFAPKRCSYLYETKWLMNPANIARMSKCDVYIEKWTPHCLEWGMTALEAAALGKVVITAHHSAPAYEKEFGWRAPVVTAHSPAQIKEQVKNVINLPLENFEELRRVTAQWAVECHGFSAVGERLKSVLRNYL